MTTIGMHYDVVPGKEEEFENGFISVLEHLKSVAGHVESHLYEDVADRRQLRDLQPVGDEGLFRCVHPQPHVQASDRLGQSRNPPGPPAA